MNDGEFAILQHEVPEAYYAELVEEIEEAARYACATAVPPGYDHNCFVLDEDNGPNFTSPYADTKHTSPDCIGWCGDVNDPPFGSCGPDPDPWACNEDGSGETGDAVETTEGDDPDSPPGGAADRRLAW